MKVFVSLVLMALLVVMVASKSKKVKEVKKVKKLFKKGYDKFVKKVRGQGKSTDKTTRYKLFQQNRKRVLHLKASKGRKTFLKFPIYLNILSL